MTATYFRTEDVEVTISDVGRRQYESEQRLMRAGRLHTEIAIGSACGGVFVIAALMIKHLLGA